MAHSDAGVFSADRVGDARSSIIDGHHADAGQSDLGRRLARLSQDANHAGYPAAADHLAYFAAIVSHTLTGART